MAAAWIGFLCGCHSVTALQTKTAMTKDKFNWRFCLCCGLFIWFIVNLLQGIFTEIQEDEAYYALYGEHLAWGYFDHPPMVGLMTFLSSIFFSGTLGVRFFTILASCLSLFVIWRIANIDCFETGLFESPLPPLKGGNAKRQLNNSQLPNLNSKLSTLNSTLLFFTLAFSVVMFNIYGFVTTPDVGLILFSALFLLVYQRYLVENTWIRAMLMGVLMACMVYSKYHAFMLLGLIVLSNLKLLKDGKFYVTCLVALALLTSHILWQVNNDFPSFKYHLSQRSEPFRWSYFLEYLPNQLLIFNPFTFGAVVYVLLKHSPERATRIGAGGATPAENQVFERGLKFILIGFFFFFWLMAFRGHVEPHWTIVCVIPAVVLVYRKALVDEKLRKYIKRFILPSLLLVMAIRILLLTPLADRFGYHGKEKYYKAVEQVAGESPVVFQGSFQQPALYHYFTGKESSTLRSYYDRKTQFDLWQFDMAWTGRKAFICGPVIDLSKTYHIDGVEFEGYLAEHFQSANRLVLDFSINTANDGEIPVFRIGDTINMDFSIFNPYDQPIDFNHSEMEMNLRVLFPDQLLAYPCIYEDFPPLQPNTAYRGQLKAILYNNLPTGSCRLTLAIGDRIAVFTPEGKAVEVRIEKKN